MKKLGPGLLIAAAFIGPGTITACTIAGVEFGYSLLWALLFSILATIILQEMSSRLGLISRQGLAEAVLTNLPSKLIRNLIIGIMLSAILIGNAAYEGGNIGGAVLGLQALLGYKLSNLYPLLIGGIAFILLWYGNYKTIERVFIGLIFLMSLSFIITALLTKPNLLEVLKGFVPTYSDSSIFTVVALIGTTIVPYNLFLHASLVNEKWQGEKDLKTARNDTIISIAIGGFISMAIVIAATAIDIKEVTGAQDLARGLDPLFGSYATVFMGIGLFTAGITSSITAPLAAAYVANSCFGWNANLKDIRFRLVWILVLSSGMLLLYLKIKPIEIIKFAQIANGILLPLIAIILVWSLNKSDRLGKHANTRIQNILGFLIILITLALGIKTIGKVFGLF
ncbi:Nramp family divalent metal transporter [Croceivirga lutea]|uniref:Nramp family divalent metal transporter n=1 Tax=Croceivirga lutea TaxID=1775167 RepID=UPI00163B2109|nr:Nramp family divalent metal transporter [Croceivirga lutea]